MYETGVKSGGENSSVWPRAGNCGSGGCAHVGDGEVYVVQGLKYILVAEAAIKSSAQEACLRHSRRASESLQLFWFQ